VGWLPGEEPKVVSINTAHVEEQKWPIEVRLAASIVRQILYSFTIFCTVFKLITQWKIHLPGVNLPLEKTDKASQAELLKGVSRGPLVILSSKLWLGLVANQSSGTV
jgi:hypothetical protein